MTSRSRRSVLAQPRKPVPEGKLPRSNSLDLPWAYKLFVSMPVQGTTTGSSAEVGTALAICRACPEKVQATIALGRAAK